MFIELHILQSFGPTNLNRDEDGNPKDCDFGGVRRARISSQCIKRAIRRSPTFARLTGVSNGMRTKRIAEQICAKLVQSGMPAEKAARLGTEFALAYAGKTVKTKSGDIVDQTNVLLYFSPSELEMIVNGLQEGGNPADLAKEIKKKTKGHASAPDIALFGRMLADSPDTNLDAAVQVAHAISTHRVDFEYDFFTAVDDLKPSDDPGAGMMGYIGFNSACYYRYARLDWQKLVANLDDVELAKRTLNAFLQASLDATPSGMQNSHDNQTPPALALAVVRSSGGGWSLANAFETPVRPSRDGGLIPPSVERLADTFTMLAENLQDGNTRTFALVLLPELHLKSLESSRVSGGCSVWSEAILTAVQEQ